MGILENNISKEVFVNTWGESGYVENWEVYGAMAKVSEEYLVDKCLTPFLNKDAVCLEIGCGGGFWTKRYLMPNFKHVIALDLIPDPKFEGNNITYHELPDRNYECLYVEDNSIDFVWSFGVFCHLNLDAIEIYLRNIYKKCKTGAKLCLYFSNNDRRPHYDTEEMVKPDLSHPLWCNNNLRKTFKMLNEAGFRNITDLMPELPDTLVYCEKVEEYGIEELKGRSDIGKVLTKMNLNGYGAEVGVAYGERGDE